MENGVNSFGTSDIITGRGLGINGFGYGYNAGYLREGALADGTALKAAIDCHSAEFGAGLDRVSAQNAETRNILKLDEILKGQSDLEFRSLDRQRDIEKQLYDNAAAAASCCCETQKLIVAENAKTRDLINNNTIADLNRQLSDCKSEKASLATINATQATINSQTAIILGALEKK